VLLRRPDIVSVLAAGPRQLIVASDAGVSVRDARTLRVLHRLPLRASVATLSSDGRTLLAGGRDGSVRLFDLVRGTVRRAPERHDGAVRSAVISADGHTAVTAGHDNRLIVWDTEGGATQVLSGHTGEIKGMALSPDGRTLFSAAGDGKVLIWDLAGGRRLGSPFAAGRRTCFRAASCSSTHW
jgi:WD40 repeat protein